MKFRDIHDYLDIYLDPVIVIITFILGYMIARLISNREKKDRQKSVLDYYLLFKKDAFIAASKQLEKMRTHKESLLDSFDLSGVSITLIPQPFWIFESLDKQELLSSWKNNGKKELQLFEQFKTINLTKLSFEQYIKYQEAHTRNLKELSIEWNASIENFHKFVAEISSIERERILEDKNLMDFHRIYQAWGKDENIPNLIETQTELLTPLNTVFEPKYAAEPNNQIIIGILQHTGKLEILIRRWQSGKDMYVKYLENTISIVDSSIQNLN